MLPPGRAEHNQKKGPARYLSFHPPNVNFSAAAGVELAEAFEDGHLPSPRLGRGLHAEGCVHAAVRSVEGRVELAAEIRLPLPEAVLLDEAVEPLERRTRDQQLLGLEADLGDGEPAAEAIGGRRRRGRRLHQELDRVGQRRR